MHPDLHSFPTRRSSDLSKVRWTLARTGRLMLIYLAIVVGLAWAFLRLPAGFLPIDDQGFITTDVQTPPEAWFNRTMERSEEHTAELQSLRPTVGRRLLE